MNTLWKIFGYIFLATALLVDPFVVAVMIYVLWSTKTIGAVIFVGFCLWLWITSKKSKPFDCWKPSTMKEFLKNW